MYTIPGYIIVSENGTGNTENGKLAVYNMQGQLMYFSSPTGRQGGTTLSIPIDKGAYIVVVDGVSWKVRVQ